MLEKHGLNQQKYAIQYRYSYMEHWKLNGCWARKIKEIRPYPQERKTNFLNGYFPKEFFLFDSFSSLIWHGWKREREAKKSVIIFKEGDSAMTPQMMVFSTKL